MEYHLGQELIWYRDNNYDPPETVTVCELRTRGQAKLSNGWIVNSDGVAEGTARIRGGRVLESEPSFRITANWLGAHRSARGGYTREQLAAIGVPWPPVHGWKNNSVGRIITEAARIKFEKAQA